MFCLHARGAGRRHNFLCHGLLAAGTMAAALSAGAPALADMGDTGVIGVVSPNIEILSDGEKYTAPAVAHAPVTANVNVWLDTQGTGRIKSLKAWLKLRTETSDWIDFRQDAYSASFPVGQRPKTLDKNYLVSIPSESHATYLAGYCNAHAQALRRDGMSDEEIFSQDRALEVALDSGLEYETSGAPDRFSLDTTGAGHTAWPEFPKMTVICKGVPAPKVEQVTLGVRGESSLNGVCSLKLSGMIRTDRPNATVKFRYRSDDGRQSDLKAVVTNHNGAAPISDEYPLSEGGTRAGKVRIVGETLNFTSDWAGYEVDCSAPAQGIATALPPKAVGVEAYATADTILHEGFLCPEKVRVAGLVKGRGTASGAVSLFAAGAFKARKEYSVENGDTVVVEGEHVLDWSDFHAYVAGAVPQQSVKFRMNVRTKGAVLVDRIEVTKAFACRKPETLGDGQGAPGSVASHDPTPPDLTMLVGTTKEKLYNGFICPAKVGLDTRILANDAMEGRAIHIATQQGVMVEPQQQVSEMDFKVVKGQKFAAGASFVMKWSNVRVVGGNPPKQTMKFVFQAARHHTVIAEIEETVVLTCRKPETAGVAQDAAGGVAPTEPAQPKSVTLSVSPLGLMRIPGYSCPQRARVHGFVQSGDVPLGGTVGVFVNGSQVKQHPVDLPANTSHNYDAEYTFPWNAATQTEQTLSFTLKYVNSQGQVVKTVEKHESFACSSIETGSVAQGALGGVTTGKPAPTTHAQQAFAIQAPKGLVRQGQIRLSGGAATAKYTLKFLRKNGGGYVAVNAAQLPKQMTGLVASFPLKALTGGRDWRLEVCPDGGTPTGCKTADFRLTRIGAAAGGASSPSSPSKPAPEQPQSTIFLVPGVGQ